MNAYEITLMVKQKRGKGTKSTRGGSREATMKVRGVISQDDPWNWADTNAADWKTCGLAFGWCIMKEIYVPDVNKKN